MVILIGDFNINYNNRDHNVRVFIDLSVSYGMYTIITENMRGNSFLDNIFKNNEN